MNATFLGLEIKRVLRDYGSMFFIVILPGFLYIIFGAAQDYSQETAGNGNVAMYIMISMAGYGAATATTSIGGRAAVERAQGWARQLGLTPLRDSGFVATKTLLAAITVGADAAPNIPSSELPGRERQRFQDSPIDRFTQPVGWYRFHRDDRRVTAVQFMQEREQVRRRLAQIA